MNTETPISYNKRTPRELTMFTEIIVDVFSEFEKVSWSNNSHIEIGFSAGNKITKSSIFLGIWFEAWESFGIPMSITIDYAGKAITDKYNNIRKYIEEKHEQGLVFKNYQGYALILFDHSYFNFQNDNERLTKLFKELGRMVEIYLV